MTALALPLPRTTRGAAFGKLMLNEARVTWRRPIGLITGVAIPVVLLVVFSRISGFQTSSAKTGGYSVFSLYVPILITFSLAMLALLGIPIPLASYRELGVLRRLSTTPVPPSWLLAAQAVVQLCVALASFAVILGLSIGAFGVPAPKNPAGLGLSFLLSAAGLFPIGLLVAALARTATAASVVGRLAFFPMMFFAGLWLPRDLMPGVLVDISNYTPLGAAVQAMQDSMQTGFPPVQPLLVLVAYAAVLGFLARRFFRWE